MKKKQTFIPNKYSERLFEKVIDKRTNVCYYTENEHAFDNELEVHNYEEGYGLQ